MNAAVAVPGTLFVVSAPSGGGKTSLIDAVIQKLPHITRSLSHTTRPKRTGEVEGRDYCFVTPENFIQLRNQGEFLESALVFEHYYGTSKAWVNEKLQQGWDVFLAIDWQGARQVRLLFKKCLSIFILPPSLSILEERLYTRQQDAPSVIQERMDQAQAEISHYTEYDYLVFNQEFNVAVDELMTIVAAARLSVPSQQAHYPARIQALVNPWQKTASQVD